MPRRRGEATAAILLSSWTDSDTAMQIVGTGIGIFGAGSLEPAAVLSDETPLRNALFDILLSLVEGGALDMRPMDDGRYAFRWRVDKAARHIARKLERAPAIVAFPWPLVLATNIGRLLPPSIYERLVRAATSKA